MAEQQRAKRLEDLEFRKEISGFERSAALLVRGNRIGQMRCSAGGCYFPDLLLTNSMVEMTKRVRDFFFVLPIDEYRLLKECLPRHSVGYNALDLDVPAGEGKRAFTCSENELQDIIQSVVQKFPIGRALATLIRQQWQPRSKAQSKKPKKSKKR